MVVSLELENFQSHQLTKLELGALTVVVGPSSSGKSALLRALCTLVNNPRGTTYVRAGTKLARVRVLLAGSDSVEGAQTHICIARGPGVNSYELILPNSQLVTFTKCGSSVPEAVSTALDFGHDDLWIAEQFDVPFLLSATGSRVAQVLGKLTGVSLLFAAVRECNRRASAAKSELRLRRVELEEVAAAAERYRALPPRRAAVERAEEALVEAQRLVARRDRLAGLMVELEAAQRRGSQVLVCAVPSSITAAVSHAEDVTIKYCRLRELINQASQIRSQVDRARRGVVEAEQQELVARSEYQDLLSSVGACPVCGAAREHQHLESVI